LSEGANLAEGVNDKVVENSSEDSKTDDSVSGAESEKLFEGVNLSEEVNDGVDENSSEDSKSDDGINGDV
jgi:hypothetical protein